MNNKGVTLLELLIVIVILGILAGISVTLVGNIVRNAEDDAVVASVANIERAIYLRSLSTDERVPPPENPGSMTNLEWETYSAKVFGEYLEGSWPRPAFGGFFVYREYQNGNQSHRWVQVIDGVVTNEDSNSLRQREPITAANDYVLIMLRFDDCESTTRAMNALMASPFADRVYQYIAFDNSKNICAFNGSASGENVIAIYIRP